MNVRTSGLQHWSTTPMSDRVLEYPNGNYYWMRIKRIDATSIRRDLWRFGGRRRSVY